MPRGGAREGAGRRSSWASGCKFEDTKLIRVPAILADRLLEFAHELDRGIDIELENRKLEKQVEVLSKKVESLELSSSLDLPLFPRRIQPNDSVTYSKKVFQQSLEQLGEEILQALNMGQQSNTYRRVKKALDRGIRRFL